MKIGRTLLSAAIVWCLVLIITFITFSVETNLSQMTDDAQDSVPELRSHILTLSKEIAKLRNENEKLMTHLDTKKDDIQSPSLDHERLRRKLELDVRELGYYVQAKIATTKDNLNKAEDKVRNLTREVVDDLYKTINNVKGYLRTTMSDFKRFEDLDFGWREEQSKILSKKVQSKIHQIMNPVDCQKSKKFVVDTTKQCGFACLIHHLTFCLHTAVFYRRPIVLRSKGWKYSPNGWEQAFKPISDTCQNVTVNTTFHWTGEDSVQDAHLPSVDQSEIVNADYLPLAIPEELAPDLVRFHASPGVWWIGQLMTYLWRHQPILSKRINAVKRKIGFNSPIVGVHVRRTDKLNSEASSHSIEEYMNLVEEYYNEVEQRNKVDKRRVFLATDQPKVVQRARQLYPQYEIVNDLAISKSAGTDKRFSFSGLLGVATDIQLLALSDFLVCTFSSQVCRAAYELMQAMHGDASQKFRSLDDVYYFGGQNAHYVRVIQRHVRQSRDELTLIPGDKIALLGNHWNGYSKGRNKINRKVGLFPSYKVEDTVPIANYPVKFLQKDDPT